MSEDTSIPPNIIEVKRTLLEAEANALLEKGWVLLSVAAGHEMTGLETVLPLFGYCLGRSSQ